MVMKIKALLFDLSGVLLDFRGPETLFALSGGKITREIFLNFWFESACAAQFTLGHCSPEEFAQGAIGYFNLDLTPAQFIENYRSWYQGPFPNALEIVAELKEKFMVGCLSNTNCIDTPRFRDELRLHELMDPCIFSNEVGLMKPDLAIYRLAAGRMALKPGEIMFFDDSQRCVDAARSIGMNAQRVDGPLPIRQMLCNFGIV